MNRITFPLQINKTGPEVTDLQAALAYILLQNSGFIKNASERSAVIQALGSEITSQIFGPTTEELVRLFKTAVMGLSSHESRFGALPPTAIVDWKTANALNETLADLGVLDDPSLGEASQIKGYIFMDYGLPAKGLKLRLYLLGLGGQSIFLSQTQTDNGEDPGHYSLGYPTPQSPQKTPLRLEVRAVGSNSKVAVLSKPLDVSPTKIHPDLNLIAPASLQPLPSEYSRLVEDLNAPLDNDLTKLKSVKETTAQQDLTFLNRATGWDARLLACAAKAQQLSVGDLSGEAEGLYGLFRAGLPLEKSQLIQIPPDVIEDTLKDVCKTGIISLDTQQQTQFMSAFTAFADNERFGAKIPGSNSTYQDMLASALDSNSQEYIDFKEVYLNHRGSPEDFWNTLEEEKGFSEEQIGELKLQGKLAYLTTGHGELMGHLQTLITNPNDDPVQLVEQGFDSAEKWLTEIYATVDLEYPSDPLPEIPTALTNSIPPAFVADTPEERIQLWAEDMAHKVRVSYPTHVLAKNIKPADDSDPFMLGAAKENTSLVLEKAASKKFQLGKTPLSTFFKDHPEIQDESNLSDEEFAIAKNKIATLQCLYQIAPNETEMSVLQNLDVNIKSAYDVTVLGVSEFTRQYADKAMALNPNTSREIAVAEASRIYGNATQVSSIIYNIFGMITGLSSNVPVAGISSSPQEHEIDRNDLIKQFPTMEELFGSMDFGEVDHCCSLLGPAAYLTDLLQLIDIGGNNETPYDALTARRPDIPNIPFTCENVNTALPYIDLVNEILEYYVAHNTLEEIPENAPPAYETGDASTAELLAEPQNIIHEAYNKLRDAQYPLTLPFDLWLETVRAFCDYFGIPFWRVLEALRPTDKLFDSMKDYDRATIFLESLNLSPAEIDLFTNSELLGNWFKLYGFDSESEATTETIDPDTNQRIDLNSAKTLSRRLGVSYKQLIELLQTAFINPKLDQLEAENAPHKMSIRAWTPADIHDDSKVLWIVGDDQHEADPTTGTLIAIRNRAGLDLQPAAPEAGILRRTAIEEVVVEGGSRKVFQNNADQRGVYLLPGSKQLFCGASGITAFAVSRKLATVSSSESLVLVANDGYPFPYSDAREFLFALNRYDNNAIPRVWVQGGATQAGIPGVSALLTLNEFSGQNIGLRLIAGAVDFSDKTLKAWVPSRGISIAVPELSEPIIPDKTAYQDVYIFAPTEGYSSARLGCAELLLFRRRLSVDEIARVEGYLAWQWGLEEQLPTSHPYASMPPMVWLPAPLELADTNAGPSFDATLLRYANGDAADGIAFLKLNLFVRLWRKLGWTIQETDCALQAFVPANAPFNGEMLRTALIYLSHLKALDERLNLGSQSRIKLTTLWANIPTTGKNSLYAQLFLTHAALKTDNAFEHLDGQDLMKDHLVALQGALGLTADEIRRIMEDAGLILDEAVLSLENISLLYRYGLLARGLNISVRELIALKQLSGINPFEPLHDGPLSEIEDDHPFTQTLRFVEVVEQVKESAFSVEDLDYLLRHRFDEIGKYRPNREATLALLKMLSDGIRAIQADNAIPAEPGAMSDDWFRQKLALLLPPDVAERFLAMLNGTAEFTATMSNVAPVDQLDPEEFSDEPAFRELVYNETLQEQTLTYRGVLLADDKQALLSRLPKPMPLNPHIPSAVLSYLLDDVEQQARAFFEKYLQKQSVGIQTTGFLDAADYPLLFKAESEEELLQQRSQLAPAFLSFLQESLIQQFLVQTLTAHTMADPALVESLLTDARLLSLVESVGAAPSSLSKALSCTSDRGLNVSFFSSMDGEGEALDSFVSPEADTSCRGEAMSATFEGYLEVPAAGAYRFYIELDKQDAEVEFQFDHLPGGVFLSGTANENDADPNGCIELKPGILYRFTIKLKNLQGGDARVLVQGKTIPKDKLSQLALYPLTSLSAAERALTLLTKSLSLVQGFALNEREVRYLLTPAEDFGGIDFKNIPTRAEDDSPANLSTLFDHFLRLLEYARLRSAIAEGTDDLIDVFEANQVGEFDKVYSIIAKLTRRDEDIVRETTAELLGQANFYSEEPLSRLWDALETIERFGVPVTSIFDWPQIVDANSDQRFAIARDLKETIKARFEPEAWQRVAQPIFDKLRQKKRDALVSYLMHEKDFTSIEQLYEYFLIDPGMEPVVQTSRIRLAISSVQTFIQRCLLNLEANVSPSAINTDQWEWMKRYRVWEANRKIFLYPENWLEPELRDDKTYQFSALEATLLQDDVSSDLVEDAFFAYLKNLDELARLDIVNLYLEVDAKSDDWSQNKLHVIGRTFSEPHKYFYRSCSHRMWTPWEPIPVEIEGDHIVPVVWRDRLYLFWVTFMEKAEPTEASADRSFKLPKESNEESPEISIPMPEVEKRVEASLHWIEYFQGQWSTQESGGVIKLTNHALDDSIKASYIHATIKSDDGRETLYINLGSPFKQAFCLVGRNSTPTAGTDGYESESAHQYNLKVKDATKYHGKTIVFSVNVYGLINISMLERSQRILQAPVPYTLLTIDQELPVASVDGNGSTEEKIKAIAPWVKPFFYQDNQNTFFVEPSITEETIPGWQDWAPKEKPVLSDKIESLPTVALPILKDSKLFDVGIRYEQIIDRIKDKTLYGRSGLDKTRTRELVDSFRTSFISSESVCQDLSLNQYNSDEIFSQVSVNFDGQQIGANGLITK
jgi:hypothetical protein